MNFDPELFIHHSDKAAMSALKAIPGFTQVMKAFMKIWDERQYKIINMSTNLKLSEQQLKKYYDMLPPICEKLGIEIPELYVELNVNPNAYTYGDTKPFIVITSGLFETLPDELIPSVLAHECGHIACHHTLYTTMGNAILNGAFFFASGLGNIALYPIQLAFSYWMRCSEFSADRAAMIYDGNADHVVETMMRFAGFDKDIMADANVDLFIEQAKEYRGLVDGNAWNKTLEFLMFKNLDHPLNAVRALEAREWEQTGRFKLIKDYLASPESTVLPVKLQLNKCTGKSIDEVKEALYHDGFENVSVERVKETEEKAKPGHVFKVEIDGVDISEDDFFLNSSHIKLFYYEPKTEEELALDHLAEIKMREGSKFYLGKHYNYAVGTLQDMGFTNLELKEMAIPKMGLFAKPDMVAKLMINEVDQFEKGDWYTADSKITIYYYVKV